MQVAVTALFLGAAVGAGAGIEHTMLHGLVVGEVRVGLGPDQAPGLTEETLEHMVESRLQAAGIALTSGAPATLWVNVTLVSGGNSECFLYVDGRLVEEARLERNGLRVSASSWSRGAYGSSPTDTCARDVTVSVEHVVDDFIETYQAMNP